MKLSTIHRVDKLNHEPILISEENSLFWGEKSLSQQNN